MKLLPIKFHVTCVVNSSHMREHCKDNKIVHVKSSVYQDYICDLCGSKFNRKYALIRHGKEQHYESKVNFAYVEHVEDMESLSSVNCELCVKTFKRKSDLMRHTLSVST